MEGLAGSNVQVVLSIKEGNGFIQIMHPTMIIATLNGHSLETDLVEPNPNPLYGTDLVWEADKSALRKMRSDHTPLKLECFAIKEDSRKEKIGHILLTLRSAQIMPRNKDVDLKLNWHKMVGLRNDLKAYEPQLLLSITIEEREMPASTPHISLESKNEQGIDRLTLITDIITPRLLHDERLIQLGPDETCRDIFLLNITAGTASNLERLVKGQSEKMKKHFSFWYQILDNDIQLKPFEDSEKAHFLNEKIVIRIRSSLSVLKNYLQKSPYLLVKLQYGDETVGQSKIDLQTLVFTDDVDEFLRSTVNASTSLEQQCFLEQGECAEDEDQVKKPCIDVQLRLQYVGVKKYDIKTQSASMHNGSILSNVPSPSCSRMGCFSQEDKQQSQHRIGHKPSEIDSHRNPGGDFGKCTKKDHRVSHGPKTSKQFSSCEILGHQRTDIPLSHSADAMLRSSCEKEYSRSIEAYRCYCLSVRLDTIEISQGPTIQNIEFRFHHPKAEITSTMHPRVPVLPNEKLKLKDFRCKLHFISSADEIEHLLLAFPPKVSICDCADGAKVNLAQAVLEVKQLFSKRMECQYVVPLLDTEEKQIGSLEVAMHLEDCGPYYRTKRRKSAIDEDLGPPILDDSLAYKIVDELETWKERQQEIFRVELRRKEERHLNLLNEEWQKRRQCLEAKLACSVDQCKMLANSLNNATEDLRSRRMKSLEKEARLIKANEDLQWRYDLRLQELRTASQCLEDDLNYKLSIVEEQNKALNAKVEPLQVENKKLQKLVNQQAEELEVVMKGSLTQDQTTSLLHELKGMEEKLNAAQRSKSFFKEQWGRAVREIHRLKLEYQQAIAVQIKNSKEELKNIDLEEVLCTDSTELMNDKFLLGQIQKEINVIKPKPTFFQNDVDDQMFVTPANVYSKSNHSITRSERSGKSEETDERLKNLIEERDSLLKTGSYTIDDAVIVKLNNEIRSLLIRN